MKSKPVSQNKMCINCWKLLKSKICVRKKFDLLNPSDNIRLSVFAGEPLVKVGDDVDAEVAHRDLLRGWEEGLALTTNCT